MVVILDFIVQSFFLTGIVNTYSNIKWPRGCHGRLKSKTQSKVITPNLQS